MRVGHHVSAPSLWMSEGRLWYHSRAYSSSSLISIGRRYSKWRLASVADALSALMASVPVAASQRGDDFMVTTGTASGKSLCFNLPVLDGLLRDPHARAIYLYPTKALAQDQVSELLELNKAGALGVRTFTLSGFTPPPLLMK